MHAVLWPSAGMRKNGVQNTYTKNSMQCIRSMLPFHGFTHTQHIFPSQSTVACTRLCRTYHSSMRCCHPLHLSTTSLDACQTAKAEKPCNVMLTCVVQRLCMRLQRSAGMLAAFPLATATNILVLNLDACTAHSNTCTCLVVPACCLGHLLLGATMTDSVEP